jgi:L-iditol 2-dehydrogenase
VSLTIHQPTAMTALMKVARGAGNVELREVAIPAIEPCDVLVRVAYVGICGSDLHIRRDTHPNHPPVILGHEFSGVIAEVGADVHGWRPGDRVVSELHGGACQRCRLCRTGNYFACPHKRPIGWWTNGAYAEFIRVPAWLLHRVPAELPLLEAALTEPLAVCMNVFQRTPVQPQSHVVVVGPGPIGILAGLAAKAAGAGSVTMVGRDTSRDRLDRAIDLGFDHVINTSHEDLQASVLGLTDGMGADLVIEAGGSEQAVQAAILAARKLGSIAALGVHSGHFQFPWNDAVFKALNMTFSFSANFLAFEQALGLLRSRAVPAHRLVDGVFPLCDWREAFERLERREALKLILKVGASEDGA